MTRCFVFYKYFFKQHLGHDSWIFVEFFGYPDRESFFKHLQGRLKLKSWILFLFAPKSWTFKDHELALKYLLAKNFSFFFNILHYSKVFFKDLQTKNSYILSLFQGSSDQNSCIFQELLTKNSGFFKLLYFLRIL